MEHTRPVLVGAAVPPGARHNPDSTASAASAGQLGRVQLGVTSRAQHRGTAHKVSALPPAGRRAHAVLTKLCPVGSSLGLMFLSLTLCARTQGRNSKTKNDVLQELRVEPYHVRRQGANDQILLKDRAILIYGDQNVG